MILKLLLFFCVFIKIVYSINPDITVGEYDCMDKLAVKAGVQNLFTFVNSDYYDYCGYVNGLFGVSCSGTFVTSVSFRQQSTTLIAASDINCFQKLTKFTLFQSYLEDNFFSGPLSIVQDIRIQSQLASGVKFSSVAPTVKTLWVDILAQPPMTLPFSWFSNINTFKIGYSGEDDPSVRTHIITYENDLSSVWAASDISLIGDNFPSFKNVKGDAIVILNTGFNKTSVEVNFKDIDSLNRLQLTATDLIPFPTPIGKIVSNTLSTIETDCIYSAPLNFIDLTESNVGAYKFTKVGRQFSFSNQFPFKFNRRIYSMVFTGGSIVTLDYSAFNGLTIVDLTNNSISGQIPPIPIGTTIQNIILDQNSLTGTLDRSYCNVDISVINNNLSGDIPSCFTCYFGYIYKSGNSINGLFAGNLFSNFLSPPPCTTVVPSILKYSNSGQFHYFTIIGNDLGGSWIQDSITSEPSSFLILWSVMNSTYVIGESKSTDLVPRVITVKYAQPSMSFMLSWDPLPPQLVNVVWSNDLNLQIIGSFFSYDSSLVTIDIGGRKCNVTSSNFNEINCTIPTAVTGGLTNIITYITVGSLTTQITLTPNINNIIINCTASHNDCNGGGICRTDSGVCVCNSGRNGPSCEFFDCPIVNSLICNGKGSCNGTTGSCECNDGYITNDCTDIQCIDPLCSGNGVCSLANGTCVCNPTHIGTSCENNVIPCPNDCSNGGICFKNNGTCACDSLHQGIDCSVDFKNCPVFQAIQCTGPLNGVCNNVTGVCSCLGNHTGPACRLFTCPAVNGVPCNGQTCTPLTGICTCNGQYQGDDCGTTLKQCPSTVNGVCNDKGSCNNVTGVCSCTDPNFQGVDCSEPFVNCPSTSNGICNNEGSCDSHIGNCTCNDQYQGNDCGTTFIQCPLVDGTKLCNNLGSCNNVTGSCLCNDPSITNNNCLEVECIDPLCSSNGKCNRNNGTCICNISPNEWSGSKCSTPIQTMSSVLESTVDGGEAIFFGWFGNVHDSPSLTIGGKDCSNIIINETTLICTALPGSGVHSVQFTQNLYTYTINNFYKYTTIDKHCPNDCTSTVNGKCNSISGYCECNGNWGGYDCSLYRNDNTGSATTTSGNFPSAPPTTITINDTNGNTNLNNQQTNYEISILALVEYDLSGKEIKNYPLLNQWSVIDKILNTDNDITYKFIQTIQNGGCNITFILEDIKISRNVEFAGLEFKLESGSVKMTVTINTYQYSSSLNTLQLQMKSTVGEIKSNDENNCNDKNIEINTVGDDNSSLNYLSIKKNSKVLSGRFINRVESDGRATYSQTTVVSKSNDSIIIGMNLPHFKNSITIDPDFSVLISPEFVVKCDKSDSKKKWVIPVAVCVSVAGAAAIIGVGILLHRRIRVERPFSKHMKKLSLLNK